MRIGGLFSSLSLKLAAKKSEVLKGLCWWVFYFISSSFIYIYIYIVYFSYVGFLFLFFSFLFFCHSALLLVSIEFQWGFCSALPLPSIPVSALSNCLHCKCVGNTDVKVALQTHTERHKVTYTSTGESCEGVFFVTSRGCSFHS